MGLGAPRKRTKLSHDPNNTQWSRSTDGYGHKLLLSQGWTPGSYLGALNAPHAHLHTDANASHIRVALKDDNLGLGAKRGSGIAAGECTGLDVFQSLLGRLNGKTDAVLAKEQKSRDDLKRAAYSERKFGNLRFVSGGILLGDRIQKLSELEKLRIAKKSSCLPSQRSPDELHTETEETESTLLEVEVTQPLNRSDDEETSQDMPSPTSQRRDDSIGKKDKAKRVAGKELSKAERRKRKEARRAARLQKVASEPVPAPITLSLQQEEKRTIQAEVITNRSLSAGAVTVASSGRHTVRQRYIAQKRLAIMDPKALNEILMVKS